MNIALIAHDGKKLDMASFIFKNHKLLQGMTLFATLTTGTYIEKEGIQVNKLLFSRLQSIVRLVGRSV